MPRLVGGHQPPRAAADEIGTHAHYSYTVQKEGKEGEEGKATIIETISKL